MIRRVEAPTIPLSPEDRAILDLESPTIAGHTCKVVVLGSSPPSVADLRAGIDARLGRAPELRRRLDGPASAPAWREVGELDLERHVLAADLPGPVDRKGLLGAVAELFAQRLDRERPLWRIDVVPLSGDGAALVWRIHHALADGQTAMRLARAVLFGEDAAPRPRAASGRAAPGAAEDDARRRLHLRALLEREFARSREPSPFDGRIGAHRAIAFARTPLGSLHDAAKRSAGATVNDAVLACVAGGLRRWIELHGAEVDEVRVKVPVSLHDGADALGNRDSFFCVSLPLGDPDAASRLERIHAETAERKSEHDAEEIDRLERELAGVSRRAQRLAQRLEASPRRFALNVSNVPGPRERERVLGAEVSALHTLAEIGERHAVRVAVVSYAGELCFGLCADPDLVDDLDVLAAGIEAEAETLTALG